MTEQTADYIEWAAEAITAEDKTNRVVRNVLLCGNKSRNGYAIPEKAFRDAKVLYEGKPVFVDHKIDAPTMRSVRDLAGHVENVRMVDGRPRGDVRLLGNSNGDNVLVLAESKHRGLGMSHVAKYKFNKERTVVESVDEVFSVDVVCGPATTNTFSESKNGENRMADEALDVLKADKIRLEADIKRLTDELNVAKEDVKKLSQECNTLKASVETVTTDRDALKAKVEIADRKAAIEAELLEAKVAVDNKTFRSEAFLNLLAGTADAAQRKTLIADRVTLMGESAKTESAKTESAKTVLGQTSASTTQTEQTDFDTVAKQFNIFG